MRLSKEATMNKTVFISVVSHSQEEMVVENFSNFPKSLGSLDIKLCIMDNTGSQILKSFCDQNKLFYYHDGQKRGFGENHNKMFSLLELENDDIFIVCNPDVLIQADQLDGLLHKFMDSNCDIFSVKTYFDKEANYVDNPDKYYPGFFNFAYSLATNIRLHYGTDMNKKNPQWISGAFMVFKQEAYKKLNGFDEGYFMYCEDIDLCYRANKLGLEIGYNADYYIEHDTQMQSRRLFSPNMLWHVQSAVRFVVKNRFFNPLVIVK